MASASGPVNLQNIQAASNIFKLAVLTGMTFSVANNGGWYDTIVFTQSPTSATPIDLSGINFHAELRATVGDARVALDLKDTANPPQFVNGGINGILFFSVDVSLMAKLTIQPYVMDLLAIDSVSGMVRNLCDEGPMIVNVIEGVTR